MDYRAAVRASENMKVPTRIALVSDAGHHLHMGILNTLSNLDNTDGFNEAVIREMKNEKVLQTDQVYYVKDDNE